MKGPYKEGHKMLTWLLAGDVLISFKISLDKNENKPIQDDYSSLHKNQTNQRRVNLYLMYMYKVQF